MKLDDILARTPFRVAVAFAVAGAEERPVGADSSLLILLRDPQLVRRVLELCLAPITLRIHCRQVCVDILFDVLDEKALARHRPYRSRRRPAVWAARRLMARLAKG